MDQDLADDLEELSSAEDFLNYFEIEYNQTVVHVNRLHIMQRYHDYLNQSQNVIPEDCSPAAERAIYKQLLTRAYQDFVDSDALTEKVFKVFKQANGELGFVPMDQILGG